jgi:hypothetical protein
MQCWAVAASSLFAQLPALDVHPQEGASAPLDREALQRIVQEELEAQKAAVNAAAAPQPSPEWIEVGKDRTLDDRLLVCGYYPHIMHERALEWRRPLPGTQRLRMIVRCITTTHHVRRETTSKRRTTSPGQAAIQSASTVNDWTVARPAGLFHALAGIMRLWAEAAN